jgi:hypothetical protein
MRHLTIALLLAGCAPAPADTDTETDALGDTGPAPLPSVTSPAAPGLELEQGSESYQEGRCPAPGEGVLLPKGALVQAWACNGPDCRAIPERLTVIRGPDLDEALLVTCAGSQRFELSWIAILP